MLNSNFYCSPRVFEKEVNNLFKRQWIFFGLTLEFDSDDSFVRKSIIGVDVFITKKNNLYRGFINQCPHRFHPIVQHEKGKTHLTCSYHCWSFHDNGQLKNIPYNEPCYKFKNNEFESIRLKSFNVEVIGNFIFICFNQKPRSIQKQFKQKLMDDFRSLSLKVKSYKKITLTKKFNWKLIQENLRDGLHPIFLHKDTLLNAVEFSPPGNPEIIPSPLLRLKYVSYGGPDVPLTETFKYQDEFQDPWPCDSRYYNFWGFPNLHIAGADGGYTFVLENYLPLSPFETQCDIYFLLTSNTLSEKLKDVFLETLEVDALKVYEEDFAVLEAIQASINPHSPLNPNHGRFEESILLFHRAYLKYTGFVLRFAMLWISDIPQTLIFLVRYSLKKFKILLKMI
jgi:nitrite reductase/ring-hydroxylating ferredoxin subunit